MEIIVFQASHSKPDAFQSTTSHTKFSSQSLTSTHRRIFTAIGLFFLCSLAVFLQPRLSIEGMLITIILSLTFFMTVQGLFHFYLMLYSWEDGFRLKRSRIPKKDFKPQHSFTAIVPARHETQVIKDTIEAINSINYPDHLKEIIIVCRYDDEETIEAVKRVLDSLNKNLISLVTFYDDPINKPHALNIGLEHATHDYVVVFDAEDHPHKDLYLYINDKIQKENPDVIQSGVQLMNYRSSWFAAFSVLEYYFWFKSILHFFAKEGAIPLGGNTVFFKKSILKSVKGWDENCLTEDADIGIRLSTQRAKIVISYDEAYTTREETPHSIGELIRQRTRWNQGFLQILRKGDWKKLNKKSQIFLAVYFLSLPSMIAFVFLFLPFSLVSVLSIKLPVIIALVSFTPILVLCIQIITYSVGLIEFTRDYRLKMPFYMPLHMVVFFIPYQILLILSAFRAGYRMIARNLTWEKTTHFNLHRPQMPLFQTNV